MKTGIVILNYNDFDNTKSMIHQIKGYKSLSDIVIIDNCSTDDSYLKLKKLEKGNITVLQSKENRGYAYGNNEGIRYLVDKKCDIVFISNPDIVVEEQVILKMLEDFQENPEIVLLAPKLNEHGVISKGWKLPGFWADFFSYMPTWLPIGRNLNQYSEKYYEKTLTEVEVVKGCFFAVRMNEFQEIGLFDENTFLYFEENILGKRLKKAGYKSYVDLSIEVIHALSASIDKSVKKLKKYKILHESLMYYEKNYNQLNIFGRMILNMMYYFSVLCFRVVSCFRK